jgi:hypothetical protein
LAPQMWRHHVIFYEVSRLVGDGIKRIYQFWIFLKYLWLKTHLELHNKHVWRIGTKFEYVEVIAICCWRYYHWLCGSISFNQNY